MDKLGLVMVMGKVGQKKTLISFSFMVIGLLFQAVLR
jgi:hypothetical protein